jgi:hypothetical protein
MCRLICILLEALRLIRPLSGGSVPHFTFPGEARLQGCAHASGAERGEEAAACPLRAFYGRAVCRAKSRVRPRLGGV